MCWAYSVSTVAYCAFVNVKSHSKSSTVVLLMAKTARAVSNMKNLAIVSGASRGIGRAVAIKLATNGYAVAINYLHDRASAVEVVAEIEAVGGVAKAIQADVANETDVIRLFDRSLELGELKVLVNNAGILRPQLRLEEMSLERVKAVFETNVYGVFLMCKQAARVMSDHCGANIVNVSSIASKTGSANEYVDYAASKGAVDSLTIGLAKELASRGIRVNAVRPGMIHTEIHAAGGEPNRVDRLASKIPLNRGGKVNEVAESIVWLSSGQASYCTGALLDVAGGL